MFDIMIYGLKVLEANLAEAVRFSDPAEVREYMRRAMLRPFAAFGGHVYLP